MCILLIVIKRNNKHTNTNQFVIPGTYVPVVEIHVHALFSKSKYPIKRDKIFFPTKPFSQFFVAFQLTVHLLKNYKPMFTLPVYTQTVLESLKVNDSVLTGWFSFFFFENKMCPHDKTPPFCELTSTERSEKGLFFFLLSVETIGNNGTQNFNYSVDSSVFWVESMNGKGIIKVKRLVHLSSFFCRIIQKR